METAAFLDRILILFFALLCLLCHFNSVVDVAAMTTTTKTTSTPITGSSVFHRYPTAAAARAAGLFWETPLIRSGPLSKLCQRDVYLKLDCLQASGSFKDRGMAHLCLTLQQQQGVTELMSSSGGNAGLAVATVGQALDMKVHVVVPKTTKELVIQKLQSLGAQVTVHGENWNQADEYTRTLINDPTTAYISPYDHELLWTGHSSLVEEIQAQLRTFTCRKQESEEQKEEPAAAILVSVGGGGLICGVLEGLERIQWTTTHVVAAETIGASSFGQAWKEQRMVRLPAITSIATSLGALEVTPVALERAQKHGHVQTSLCTDAEAVAACLALARDHRLLVEPACGAALATLYSDRLRPDFLQTVSSAAGPIVVEVCGGSGVTIELLMQWKRDLLDTSSV